MRFSCQQSALSEALNNVSRGAAVKSTLYVLEGIRLRLTPESTLQLTGYDLETGIQTEIPVSEGDRDGVNEVVVNNRLFGDMIKRMPGDTVTVEIDDQLSTHVSGGGAEFRITSMPAKDYPDIPQVDMANAFELSQGTLKEMVGQTIFAVAVTDTKPILTGELFHIEDNMFKLVAIDGYRLAIRSEITTLENTVKFVVPAKTLKELSNLLKDEKEELCTIAPGRKHIIFTVGNYRVISRLLEGEFHNYQGSIPDNCPTEVEIDTRIFIGCLERCSLLINEKLKAPVKCTFSPLGVEMVCETELGKFNEIIKAGVTGPEVTIGFNCRYLLDALKASGESKLKLSITNGLSPMKISPMEGNSFTYLVLPVRLK